MSRLQAIDQENDPVAQENRSRSSSMKSATGKTRPRRKSSGLGSNLRGDTSAPAVSTLNTAYITSPVSPPLSPRSSSSAVPRRSKRRKIRSFLRRWKHISLTHTWINPLVLMCIIVSLYLLNPTPSNPLHKALFLSYELPADHPHIPSWARHASDVPTYYGKGRADLAFMGFYIIVLSFTREFLMQWVILPAAIRWGIRSRAKQFRFMEQAYTAIYFIIFGPYGMYVMSKTPIWYFNTTAMYEEFPHKAHDGLFKAYYLLQASYWTQQAIVLLLGLEAPRKDFKELVAHHVITLTLIGMSYRFHYTYMGLAVYITHDVSDFFLATSKVFNYLNLYITEVYFATFSCIWIYLRHFVNLSILYSVATEMPNVGDFTLNWETEQYKCRLAQVIIFSLLSLLQSINLFWLYYILRILYNAVFKAVTKDMRSEEEDNDSVEDAEEEAQRKAELEQLRGLSKPNGTAKTTGLDTSGGLQDVPEVKLNGHTVESGLDGSDDGASGVPKSDRKLRSASSPQKKENLRKR